MASLLEIVSEDQFDLPTPCPEARVGDLVDHVGAFTKGFTAVARKDVDGSEAPAKADAANLEVGWRARMVADLATLAEAWRDPAAWEGMTSAAGVPLPGAVAGPRRRPGGGPPARTHWPRPELAVIGPLIRTQIGCVDGAGSVGGAPRRRGGCRRSRPAAARLQPRVRHAVSRGSDPE